MTENLKVFPGSSANFADGDNHIVECPATKVTPFTSSNSPCPTCGSTRRNLVKLPSYCPNDAERCAGCDSYLASVPKPKNQRTRRSGRGGARW